MMKKADLLDLIKVFNTYAQSCANALNDAGVKPLEAPYGGAVMIVAHGQSVDIPPIAGSLNYYEGTWRVDEQLDMPQPTD